MVILGKGQAAHLPCTSRPRVPHRTQPGADPVFPTAHRLGQARGSGQLGLARVPLVLGENTHC